MSWRLPQSSKAASCELDLSDRPLREPMRSSQRLIRLLSSQLRRTFFSSNARIQHLSLGVSAPCACLQGPLAPQLLLQKVALALIVHGVKEGSSLPDQVVPLWASMLYQLGHSPTNNVHGHVVGLEKQVLPTQGWYAYARKAHNQELQIDSRPIARAWPVEFVYWWQRYR